MGGLSTAGTLTREWALLWSEHQAGFYSISAYAATHLMIELFMLRVLPSVAFAGIRAYVHARTHGHTHIRVHVHVHVHAC